MTGARIPARRTAHALLVARTRVQGASAGTPLDRLSRQERRAAFQLVQGVRRRQILLDAVIRSLLDRPGRPLPAEVRGALRLGLYEILFRPKAAPAGVVSAAVELVRKRPWKGLVNAVLRRAVQGVVERVEGTNPESDRRTLWIGEEHWVLFDRDVLPDRNADPVGWLSRQYGLTPDAVTALRAEHPGDHELILRALDTPRTLSLRPTWRLEGLSALRERLAAEGVGVQRELPPVLELTAGHAAGRLAVVQEGLAVVQDRTSAEVAPFLDPRPGDLVLDLCAAPGGKTIHIAELMQDRGEVLALDVNAGRLERVTENARRVGLSCITTQPIARDGSDLPAGPFDRVLVDAPCSNSGVVMRKVEARSRMTTRTLCSLARLQATLLQRAAPRVATGGVLVYSTCSILRCENQDVIAAFLADHPDFTLDAECLRLPHETLRDGGFRARLLRAQG